MAEGLKSLVILTTSVYYFNGGLRQKSTYRGRGEIGGGYLTLSCSVYTTTLLVMVDRVKVAGRAPPTLTRLG
jgi:hypothetical protein